MSPAAARLPALPLRLSGACQLPGGRNMAHVISLRPHSNWSKSVRQFQRSASLSRMLQLTTLDLGVFGGNLPGRERDRNTTSTLSSKESGRLSPVTPPPLSLRSSIINESKFRGCCFLTWWEFPWEF